MICNRILTPIVVFVRTVIQVVREVVRTVCEWVSSVIRRVVEVVERVCSWLPWPLSDICNLVTKLVEVFETVWNWVCREVIDRIIDWVEAIVTYIIYIAKWVCWVIDWVVRFPELVLCWLGVETPKIMRVCIKILTDAEGVPAVQPDEVNGMMRDSAAIFARCNIRLVVESSELIRKEEFLTGTRCEFSGMFSDFYLWFSARACPCCPTVTVYFVASMDGASGCAYPGNDWVIVASPAGGGDGTVVVQEIGHLADLWGHSSDPNNVMTDQPGGTHDQITSGQCCMIRTSRFASTPGLQVADLTPVATATTGLALRPAEEPFLRQDRGARAAGGGAEAPAGAGPAAAAALTAIGLVLLAVKIVQSRRARHRG